MFCSKLTATGLRSIILANLALCLSGCMHGAAPTKLPAAPVMTQSASTDTAAAKAGNSDDKNAFATPPADRLAQCSHELEALKTYNPDRYKQYQQAFTQLSQSSAAYLAVSHDIGSDINNLVRPKYQFALASLCYRIRADLSTALINQVKVNE